MRAALLVLAAIVAACGSVSGNGQTSCGSGTVLCGGTCVDTALDPGNCGTCGHACGVGEVCSAQQCGLTCVGGSMMCGAMCVDTNNDPDNCGGCGSGCGSGDGCMAGACRPFAANGYFVLSGTVDPTTVFNTIAETYKFNNNLTNSIWYRPTNTILSGEFSTAAYWSFTEATNNYPTTPNNGSTIHARMVLVPATNSVVYSTSAASNGVGLGTYTAISVANINPMTGALDAGLPAVFSDGFTGSCQLLSSSATELLCFDGTQIRRYQTHSGSNVLTFIALRSLSVPIPAAGACNAAAACYGSTFAYDGAYYYFASDEGIQTNLAYVVYDTNGTFVSSYAVGAGGGAVNGLYFDWSVGRYSAHDGFGMHTGGAVYMPTGGGGSDTHCFGPISTKHTLF